jgi:hypothetical protein
LRVGCFNGRKFSEFSDFSSINLKKGGPISELSRSEISFYPGGRKGERGKGGVPFLTERFLELSRENLKFNPLFSPIGKGVSRLVQRGRRKRGKVHPGER